jgi:methylenetetrahydrofolate dehydrogenase (NADP+)/methenyltetrahydrofolate cyclohydrolase
MTASIIDGKAIAADLRARVAAAARDLEQKLGRQPALAVVLVGEDPASGVYVRAKSKAAREAGLVALDHHLPADVGEQDLLALVSRLNADDSVDGILVQMPLPKGISAERVIGAIDPLKDVDGLTPENAGRLSLGRRGLVPCTPQGCLILARSVHGQGLAGREVVVVGRSILVGKPVAMLFLNADCTVTVAHSRTQNLAEHVRRAEILVAAVGRAGFIPGDWIRPGATVLDVGINRIEGPEGKPRIVGDVDFSAAAEVAGAITPVPGGAGPMTIACLLANTVRGAAMRVGLPEPVL